MFLFNPSKISQLTLTRLRPQSGGTWSAELQKIGKNWEILSQSPNQILLDRFADETFIFHLVDSFTSIKRVSSAPLAPLESFELAPPHWIVQWKSSQGNQSFQFQLGAQLNQTHGYYWITDGNQIWVAQGSTFKLLERIQSFEDLRKRTWTHLLPDSVDEIELKNQGKPFFYAQREGDQWTDKNHRPVKPDIELILQSTLLANCESFVDETEKAQKLHALLEKKSLLEIRLSGRKFRTHFLRMKPDQKTLWGTNTSRFNTVFQLNPRILQIFNETFPHFNSSYHHHRS